MVLHHPRKPLKTSFPIRLAFAITAITPIKRKSILMPGRPWMYCLRWRDIVSSPRNSRSLGKLQCLLPLLTLSHLLIEQTLDKIHALHKFISGQAGLDSRLLNERWLLLAALTGRLLGRLLKYNRTQSKCPGREARNRPRSWPRAPPVWFSPWSFARTKDQHPARDHCHLGSSWAYLLLGVPGKTRRLSRTSLWS